MNIHNYHFKNIYNNIEDELKLFLPLFNNLFIGLEDDVIKLLSTTLNHKLRKNKLTYTDCILYRLAILIFTYY